MKSTKNLAVIILLCAIFGSKQIIASESDNPEEKAEARSEYEGETSGAALAEESMAKSNRRIHTSNPGYHHSGMNPVYQPEGAVYKPQLGLGVSSYQPQSAGGSSLPSHPKETIIEKKPITPVIKNTKPVYYPKESSYSTVPEQPNGPEQKSAVNSGRFVADPNRNQVIEEFSPNEIQQLTMRQPHYPYTLVPQPLTMPGYNFNYIAAVPGAASPYVSNYQPQQAETATVKYTQTEHGFIDRVWGEVMTVREAITNDFFGSIPTFLRNIWDAIVGAVTSTSARMFNSFSWLDAFQLIVKQLS